MNLKTLANDDLFSAYRQACEALRLDLKRVASIWCEMVRRGLDVSKLRQPLAKYFPDIDAGRIIPDLILMLAGCEAVLDAAATLDVEQQKKLVEPDALVAVKTATGTVQHRKPHELTIAEARQVFRDGKMVPVGKQVPVKPVVFQPRVVARAPDPKPVPETAMAAAFVSADYDLKMDVGLQVALDAFGRWPAADAQKARYEYVETRMASVTGQKFWASLDPRQVFAAVTGLLRAAELAIELQRPVVKDKRKRA